MCFTSNIFEILDHLDIYVIEIFKYAFSEVTHIILLSKDRHIKRQSEYIWHL